MTKLLILVFAGILSTSAFAQDSTEAATPTLDIQPAAGLSLDDFLWLNRVLVVFADTERDPSYIKQMDLINERPEEFLVRDVVIITDTNPREPSAIRTKLRPRGFALVFVDKDGVVKLRKPAPWDAREITRSIDKTPLRQQEVRGR